MHREDPHQPTAANRVYVLAEDVPFESIECADKPLSPPSSATAQPKNSHNAAGGASNGVAVAIVVRGLVTTVAVVLTLYVVDACRMQKNRRAYCQLPKSGESIQSRHWPTHSWILVHVDPSNDGRLPVKVLSNTTNERERGRARSALTDAYIKLFISHVVKQACNKCECQLLD